MTLAVVVTMVPFPVFNTDTWIQLASGRYFWEHGLPATDPFTYTGARPYAEPEWIICALFHLVYTQTGWVGMWIVKCVVRGITYLLVYLTARGLGASLGGITLVAPLSAHARGPPPAARGARSADRGGGR
jgi:hypothetical protein